MSKPVLDSLNLTQSTEKLKQLIEQYPDYPIVVLAGEEAMGSGYYYTYCSDIGFGTGMILDCVTPYTDDEVVITDEDDFKAKIADCLADEDDYSDLSDEEFDELIDDIANEYEQYWKNVIIIWANN